jgi:oxygen-dependent protoporphyrinogen oxidase
LRVVVVGGGLGGLFIASELLASGVEDLVVVEADELAGGIARTVERDGFSLEPAVGSFNLPHPHITPILERAGVGAEKAIGAAMRHVFAGGQLISLRPSPAVVLSPLLPVGAKLRAIAEPLVSAEPESEDESLAAFCRRRLGPRAGDLFGSLMAAGVYAGDPAELSAEAAFPMLVALEREHGSVVRGALRRRRAGRGGVLRPSLHVPEGGMASLADRVAESLNGRFRGGFPVGSVHRDGEEWIIEGPERLRADVVVMAVAPLQAAELLGGEIAGQLRGASTAQVAVVGIAGYGPSPLPEGFGALVRPAEGMMSAGALFESSYAPARAPHGGWLAKVILGGAPNPELAGVEDEQVALIAIRELARIVDSDLSPGFVEVVRHRPGIPQYVTGHREWLAGLRKLQAPGLHLAGWAYRGVGITGLATDAARTAEEISRPGA